MKSVRIYKQLKNDLYNWGQVLAIVRDFLLACSIILFIFVLISLMIGGFPIVISICVTYRGSKHIMPNPLNDTVLYGYILHALSMSVAILGFLFTVVAYRFKKTRRVDLGYWLEKITVIGVIFLNIMLVLLYFFGNVYLGNA